MIRRDGSGVWLEGQCSVEEAETLLEHLQSGQVAELDLGSCTFMHTAVLQLVIASALPIAAPPQDAFLAGLLAARSSR